MRIRTVIIVLICVWTICAASPRAQADELDLEVLLDGLTAIAKQYEHNALRFTCDEVIQHHTHQGRKDYKFTYIYVNSEDGLVDYRVKYGSAGKKKAPKPIDLARYRLPAALFRAYSWIFLFNEARRDFYNFELLGEEIVHDRRAAKIRFEPIPPYQAALNEFFGIAWVDVESIQLLRVEAMHHTEQKKKEWLAQERASPNSEDRLPIDFETIETDFRFVEQGLRFPSEVMILRASHRVRGESSDSGTQIYKVRQKYRNYQFFGVSATEQIEPER